jgi:hypothetical protein
MDEKLKLLKEEAAEKAPQHKPSRYWIKFSNGWVKDLNGPPKPGNHTAEEIFIAMKTLHNEEWDQFFKTHGYGLEEIERIGYKKFIQEMGWSNKDQITSWRTDKIHVMPCPSCRDEFGLWESHIGLCSLCSPRFFYYLVDSINALEDINRAEVESSILFLADEKFREAFRKDADDVNEAIAIASEKNDFIKLAMANNILRGIYMLSIGVAGEVESGQDLARAFPVQSIEKPIKEHLITQGIRGKDVPEVVDFLYEKLENCKSDDDKYNIIKCSTEMAIEMIKILVN